MSTDSPASSRDGTDGGGRLASFIVRRSTAIRWISLGLILLSLIVLMRTLPTQRIAEVGQGWIDGLGIWGPLALGVIYVAAALLFIPGSVLTLAAGALYGMVLGTVIVSLASTTVAALAFLIARHAARDRVRRSVEQSPRLAAVDEAIGEQGWKIVALLRLSPAVPFNLQNYLYGVTSIRFWPCVLTSWLAMLPGTFMYVYIGSLGKTAAAGRDTSLGEWVLRGVGLVATIAVSVYVARLARKAIRRRTNIEGAAAAGEGPSCVADGTSGDPGRESRSPWGTLFVFSLAVLVLVLAGWATARRDAVRQSVERLLELPPAETLIRWRR